VRTAANAQALPSLEQDEMFERPVTFQHGDGGTSLIKNWWLPVLAMLFILVFYQAAFLLL
jgi:hypothetical protein